MAHFELRPKPPLIDAVTGNGHLLLTLGQTGEPYRLFWPHIDYGQHLDRWLEGVYLPGHTERAVWQDAPGWLHSQRYEGETALVSSRSEHPGLGLAVERLDAVAPRGMVGSGDSDLWLRRVRVTNIGPVALPVTYLLFQSLWFEESPLYNTSLFLSEADALVHYRRQVYMATGADRAVAEFTCSRRGQAWDEVQNGHLAGRLIDHGDSQGALAFDPGTLQPGESAELHLFTVLGSNLGQVTSALQQARTAGPETLATAAGTDDVAWLAQALPLRRADGSDAHLPPAVHQAYRRSLLVMKLMTDAGTGAIIAAPEFDPAYENCGGYAYAWGRDAAYITVAMDRAGLHGPARAFYRWAVRAQEKEGLWVHRHTTEGMWGSSWGLVQIDETGSLLFGLAEHVRLTGDVNFAREVFPSVARAVAYLGNYRHPRTGLAGPAVDLWEERSGYLIYSSAAVAGGLRAAAELADRAEHPEDAERWRRWAAGMALAIRREGWDAERGAYLRTRDRQVDGPAWAVLRQAGEAVHTEPGLKGYTQYLQDREAVLDASLLGLAVPFQVVAAGDATMESTARRLEEALTAEGFGGLRRYEGDRYRGGNPWVLCTLWLGQYEAAAGRPDRAAEILDWALQRQAPLGLLPEQVDSATGEPAWVLPLTWSHAMLLLLVQQLAQAGHW
ncbi:MAG: glycoside hydrolase family 15 protein [Firmicutes bacterium]|nr:glycoside hydrolase family 15 protein [Bacillota bacterium]